MEQNIRIPLKSNTIYVSGTVNGISKTWTRADGNWWETSSEKSADGVYRVALSIVYADGKTTQDSTTLYYGLFLITDRTQQDVDNRTIKGQYNASDLNRVGAAMAYIRDRLISAGYSVSITPKTTWTELDVPTKSSMKTYLDNALLLGGVISLPDNAPEPPKSMDGISWREANSIESLLEMVDLMLTNSLEALYYSGEIYSGEVI